MLFHEVARTFSNPVISVFSDLITFGSDDEWQELMAQKANPEKVLSGTGEKIDILSAGYFAALDDMGAMNELLQYCADEVVDDRPTLRDSQGEQTFVMLAERTRSIHVWRVKLDDPIVKTRFIRLTNKIREQLDSDSELRSMDFDADTLLMVVDSLGANWRLQFHLASALERRSVGPSLVICCTH